MYFPKRHLFINYILDDKSEDKVVLKEFFNFRAALSYQNGSLYVLHLNHHDKYFRFSSPKYNAIKITKR